MCLGYRYLLCMLELYNIYLGCTTKDMNLKKQGFRVGRHSPVHNLDVVLLSVVVLDRSKKISGQDQNQESLLTS